MSISSKYLWLLYDTLSKKKKGVKRKMSEKNIEICVCKFSSQNFKECKECNGTQMFYGKSCPYFQGKPLHEIEDVLDYRENIERMKK